MRVLIFGTGALGSLLGARLARAGRHEVTLAGSWPQALDHIARHGVEVSEPDGAWSARPRVVRSSGPLPAADTALVLVKAHQTEAVAAHVRRAVAAGATAFTFQNGLGQRELLAAASGRAVGLGVALVGARLEGPGCVASSGPGRILLDAGHERADRLAQALDEAGTPVTQVEDVDVHAWRKLVANAAINALTALHGLTNGELLRRLDLRADFEAAAREAAAVAAASGIELGLEPVALAAGVGAATASNRSSMLQDLERGAPTEIDALNGALVEAGRRLGVPTPVNERLWRAVRLRHPLPAGAPA